MDITINFNDNNFDANAELIIAALDVPYNIQLLDNAGLTRQEALANAIKKYLDSVFANQYLQSHPTQIPTL
jgi:hypothetical protein